jgi:hypothetical protein
MIQPAMEVRNGASAPLFETDDAAMLVERAASSWSPTAANLRRSAWAITIQRYYLLVVSNAE